MDKAPITDKDLSIPPMGHNSKFRDVRKRAKDDEVTRHKKAKRDKLEKLPKYKVGQVIVLAGARYRSRHYHLVEIIDFEESYRGSFEYYGIVKKTTDYLNNRVGRLVKFSEQTSWSSNFEPANVADKGIKWI